MLHISVRRVGKAFLLLTGSVQTYQITSYIFDFLFGAFFESFPRSRTESCDGRFCALTTFVFADPVQVMNRDKHIRPVSIIEFDHLLRFAVHRRGHQSTESRYTMVGVNHIIAYLQLIDLAKSNNRLSSTSILARQGHAMIPLEDLMVGIAADLQTVIHKSLMQSCIDADKG